MCGHYTQVVAESNREIGCAKQTCTGTVAGVESWGASGTKTIVVCNYNPPGNYVNYRPYASGSYQTYIPQNDFYWDRIIKMAFEDEEEE